MRDYSECQAFVEHLRREHNQIHELVFAVDHELRSEDPPCSAEQIHARLSSLRETLARHFEQEEEGGCMEEAACFDPRLSREVSTVEKEHPGLLYLLDGLLERTSDCSSSDYRASFHEFATALHAHEAAENRILHTAFGTGEFEPHETTTPWEGQR